VREEQKMSHDGPIDSFDPPLDQPPPSPGRNRKRVMGAGVAALLVVGLAVALWPSNDVVAPPATSAPTSSTTSTSTSVAVLPGGTVEIATAKPEVTELQVLAGAPPGWDDMEPAQVTSTGPEPPASEPSLPAREPLPSAEEPIAGRFVTATGWSFTNPGPYEPGQPFTMLVRERRGEWAEVLLPVRPNGTTGWVSTADVDLSTTAHRIEINLAERMLRAYDDTELIVETPVVIGSAFTPTPTGTFFVTDIVPQTSASFGPVALATDGYSEVMDDFDTGAPVVALHGTNAPELVGQARSNGCIRVPNELIQQLADTVPAGTPVYVFP